EPRARLHEGGRFASCRSNHVIANARVAFVSRCICQWQLLGTHAREERASPFSSDRGGNMRHTSKNDRFNLTHWFALVLGASFNSGCLADATTDTDGD